MTNIDPRAKSQSSDFPDQEPHQPGLTEETAPTPDHGERSYRGHGRLAGQRALITGGDSGIGRAIAIAYAREGANVAINYLETEQEDAEETKRLVEEAGQKALLLPGDLRDEQLCTDLVKQTVNKLGGLEVLINNAAYQKHRPEITDLKRDEVMQVFETNLVAPLLLTRSAIPHLHPGSNIIFTTSIQAYNPSPFLIDYASTKAALVSLTQSLATELGPKGIRVNAVAPGPIWTPLIPATGWDEKQRKFGQDTPLGRAGQPAELAGAYVYLASEDASYTSGTVLAVTGGKHL